jgi:hypothetical protein
VLTALIQVFGKACLQSSLVVPFLWTAVSAVRIRLAMET